MPSAPFAISSQSRKKLKAFAFDERRLGVDEDKENQEVRRPTKPANHLTGKEDETGNVERSQTSERELPRTPAVKIPFEDLIANTEDAFNCPPPLATPKDHVLWETHPDSTDASGAAAGTQRSRKRAHSSSPASSQLGRSDQFSAHKDALNLDALNKSLRTQNNDPTQDLWSRYATANAKKAEQTEPTLPPYANLLPSSPQTPSTASKESGLRRTHSCGIEWPASKAKRRRVEARELHGRTKELFAASRKEILRRDLSNNTRVGLLLEKIQESLTKKIAPDESPSSSSPLPDRRSQALLSKKVAPDEDPTSSSPLPDRRSQALLSPTKPQAEVPPQTTGSPHANLHGALATPQRTKDQHDASFSSEFSDDGLDIEVFESVEQALAQTAAGNGSMSAQEPCKGRTDDCGAASSSRQIPSQQRGPPGRQLSGHVSQNPPPSEPQTTSVPQEFDDEFDDDDDDEDLMNEMLDLAAQYDSQPNPSAREHPGAQSAQTDTNPKLLDTFDEFEDAFDDDDEIWEGIANATSAKATTAIGSTNHVRPG